MGRGLWLEMRLLVSSAAGYRDETWEDGELGEGGGSWGGGGGAVVGRISFMCKGVYAWGAAEAGLVVFSSPASAAEERHF